MGRRQRPVGVVECARDPLEEGRYETGRITTYSRYNKIVESVSKNKTLIFCVDDAHWLDLSSAELLESIMHKNRKNRILFVITARTPGGAKNLDGLETLERIRERMQKRSCSITIKPFAEEAYPELIGRLSGKRDIGREYMRRMYERTKGNPFWLTHALNSPAGDMRMPDKLSRSLESDLEDVYASVPQSRKALGYAAVLGRRFSLYTLASLLDADVDVVFDTLRQLEKRGLVQSPGNQEYFRFEHDIAREYIYESLGVLRKSYHKKVAELLERADGNAYDQYAIAYHYSQTDCKKSALDHLRRAARASEDLASGTFGKLEKCLEIARDLGMKKEEIVPIKLDYARALLDMTRAKYGSGALPAANGNPLLDLEMGHVKSCMGMLEEIINDERASAREKAISHTLISRCYRKINTPESGSNAIRHAQTAADMLQGGELLLLGDAYAYLATVYDYFEADTIKARRAYGKACDCYRDSPTDLARLHRKAGMVMGAKRAIASMKKSLIVFEENGMGLETARCLNNLGVECMYAGEVGDSRKFLSKSIRKFQGIGTHEIDMPHNNLGLCYLQEGRHKRAMRYLLDALDLVIEPYNAISVKINVSTASRKMGNPDEAIKMLKELEASVADLPEPRLQDYYGFNRGVAHLQLGEWDAAKEWLQKFPINAYRNDKELAWAKRTRAVLEACKTQEGSTEVGEGGRARMESAFAAERPQKWLYEADYYPCYLRIRA